MMRKVFWTSILVQKTKTIKNEWKKLHPLKVDIFVIIYSSSLVCQVYARSYLTEGSFIYKLAYITEINKSDNDGIYVKWVVDWKNKLFFKINKNQIEKWKGIFIDKMISIERWLGKIGVIELCKYYNVNQVVVEPSVYWMGFWQKNKRRTKMKRFIL